jgi:hypothetical protein
MVGMIWISPPATTAIKVRSVNGSARDQQPVVPVRPAFSARLEVGVGQDDAEHRPHEARDLHQVAAEHPGAGEPKPEDEKMTGGLKIASGQAESLPRRRGRLLDEDLDACR